MYQRNDTDAFRGLAYHLMGRVRGTTFLHTTPCFRRTHNHAANAEGMMKLVELLVADYDAMVKPRRLEATSLVHASPAGPATPPLAAPTPARIQRALQRLGLPEGDDPLVASVAVEVRAPPPAS